MINDNEEYEEYEATRSPQTVLFAVWLLYYYMQRTPGKPRPALAYYAIAMAARILGLHGLKDRWSLPPNGADERLRRFGLEPTIHQVVDPKRWAIAWKILNRHWEHGCPWRLQSDTFEKEFDQASRRDGNIPIPEAAPVTFKKLRLKNRPKKEAWNVKKFKPSEPPKPTGYRPQNIFQTRVNRYMAELEEQ